MPEPMIPPMTTIVASNGVRTRRNDTAALYNGVGSGILRFWSFGFWFSGSAISNLETELQNQNPKNAESENRETLQDQPV